MISIVIPVYNEEKFLPRCLEALKNQDTTEVVEIIVVDNNCTDRTLHIVMPQNALVIPEAVPGVGAARRAGVAEARGDLVVTIDADTILPSNYLSIVHERFDREPTLACFGGIFIFYDAPWWKNILRVSLAHSVYWSAWILTGGHVGPMGNNMAFRKSIYNKTRGFNAGLQFGEDMDLVKQLHQYGKIVLDFNLRVPTSARRYQVNVDLFVYTLNLIYYCFTGRPWRNTLVPKKNRTHS